MKHARLLLVFFCAYAISAHSQSIKGKLLDLVDNKPLAGATLNLTSLKDSAQQFSNVADSSGIFEFTNLPVDSFFLQVSFISYEPYKQIVATNDSIPVTDIGTLFIPKTTVQLGGVTITGRTPPTQQKGDTTQYNASQFKVNPDATTEDLIKKMPGITVDKDGTVTAQGEQVRKVTIDGQEFFGDDATAALRNLPSEIVDKIQVFDRLSDQAQFTGFDDGNAVKAINVVTKADMRNGQFGRVYAGYGTDERYHAGGNMTFFNGSRRISLVGQTNNINQQNFASQDLLGVTSNPNRGGGGRGGGGPRGGGGGNFGGQNNFLVGQRPGISKTNALGINFSDVWAKKLTISGSYFFNNNNNKNNELTSGQYTSNDTSEFYRENSFSNSDNYNHRFDMRAEYKIDSNNSLIIRPRLRFQKSNSISTLSSDLTDQIGNLINQNNSYDRFFNNGYNFENEITYRHAFNKPRRTISLEIETEFDKNNGESFTESVTRSFDNGNSFTDSLHQFTDQFSNGRRVEFNLAYTEPVGEKGQIQLNYRPSFSDNKADQQTYHFDNSEGKFSIFDDSLSNKLDNTYNTQNAGISYRIGDRENQFSIGADYQYSVLDGDQVFPYIAKVHRTFSNILPNLRWQKRFSPQSSIRIFYRGRTNAPSVTQLQDVINIKNRLFPTSGNPDLKQNYTHFIATRYNYTNSKNRTSFFANLFVQRTQNHIANATFTIDADSVISGNVILPRGARLTKPVNLDGYWNARSFLTFGMPLNFIKSNLNWNAGFSYTRTPGLIDNIENISNNYNYNIGAVLASNINEYIDFSVSYSANFSQVRNTNSPELDDNYFNHTAGLQLNLLSKNGWVFRNDLTNQMYRGLGTEFNQDYWLWNISLGKKFLKDQKGELQLSVFDLLKQNQAITREVTETSIVDVRNEVLQQYFMVTFFYKLRNFGKANTNSPRRDRDRTPRF